MGLKWKKKIITQFLYPNCIYIEIRLFPDFLCVWMRAKQGWREEDIAWEQIRPSVIQEAAEVSAGPGGDVFVQELQQGEMAWWCCSGFTACFSDLSHAVRCPWAWQLGPFCSFSLSLCLLHARVNKQSCLLHPQSRVIFADVSKVALSTFNEKNYLQSSVKFKA